MGMILMLMTFGGLGVAAVLLTFAIYRKKLWLRNFVLGSIAVWFLSYFVILIGFSVTSEEKALGLN